MDKEKVRDAFEKVYRVRITDEDELLDIMDEIDDCFNGDIEKWINYNEDMVRVTDAL